MNAKGWLRGQNQEPTEWNQELEVTIPIVRPHINEETGRMTLAGFHDCNGPLVAVSLLLPNTFK